MQTQTGIHISESHDLKAMELPPRMEAQMVPRSQTVPQLFD